MSQSEEFKSLNVCQISKVVSNDKLNVKCESQVYTAVTRWVRHDYHNRKQYFTMLVAAVSDSLGFNSKQKLLQFVLVMHSGLSQILEFEN